MDVFILDNIPFDVTLPAALKRLHDDRGKYADIIAGFLAEAADCAKPKAMYKVSYIDGKQEDLVVVDGVKLSSKVVRKNFDKINRVFPYAATCGVELDQWSHKYGKYMLEEYFCDCIKEMVVHSAVKYLFDYIKDKYRLTSVAKVNPGSLADWPIEQQKNLFAILGDPEKSIGVHLTDSFLMIPTKSVSGICFPTETKYENCQLCTRVNCPGRRATYDKQMYRSVFGNES